MVKKRVKFDITAVDKTQAAFGSVNRSLGGMKAAVAGLGLGLLVGKTIQVSREFSVLKASLKTVTGSAENASVAFKQISEFAAATPFSVQQSTEAFIRLESLGLKPSIAAMESYGNTASAMGKSLLQFVEAIADATTGEFERLKEFGIKAKSVGDDVAFTFRGVTTEVGKNADEIEAFLRKIGQTDFAGAMEERAATIDGALSNLSDSTALLANRMGEGGLAGGVAAVAFALSDASTKAGDAAEEFGRLSGIILTTFADEIPRALEGFNIALEYSLNRFGIMATEPAARMEDLIRQIDLLQNKIQEGENDLIPDFLQTFDFDRMNNRIRELTAEFNTLDDQIRETSALADRKPTLQIPAPTTPAAKPASVQTASTGNGKAFDAHVKAHQRYVKQLEVEGQRITDNATAFSRYSSRLLRLQELLENGAISQTVFRSEVDKAREEMKRQGEQAEKTGETIGISFEDGFAVATKALDRFVADGEFNLKSLGRLALNVFTDIMNQQMSVSGGGGGSSVDLGTILSTGLSLFSGGGGSSFERTSVSGGMGGFASGGSFMVGGAGGTDSQRVSFNASPDERVTIETPGQRRAGRGSAMTVYIDARGATSDFIDGIMRELQRLEASIAPTAISAAVPAAIEAMRRNPELRG